MRRIAACLRDVGRASVAATSPCKRRSADAFPTRCFSSKRGFAGTGYARPKLLELGYDELADILEGTGRAKNLWKIIKRGTLLDDIGSLVPAPTARRIQQGLALPTAKVSAETLSSDGTRKLLVELRDSRAVEAVLIPIEENPVSGLTRTTLCVSSQVGCARGCVFCATGKMGLLRNLTPEEIVTQVYLAHRVAKEHDMPEINNLVFMGMGEPLNNIRAVRRALSVISHPHTFNLSKNMITVSTVGTKPEDIRAMGDLPARMAWSVHAADDELRKKLVPTTQHRMAELRDAFVDVLTGTKRNMLVQVTMMEGVNDSPEHARQLAALLHPLRGWVKVNLLPYNDTGVAGLRASSEEATGAFRDVLVQDGYFCSVRKARGAEDGSACGQLCVEHKGRRSERTREGAAAQT